MTSNTVKFGGGEVHIDTAETGKTIDILPRLADANDYHGDPHVDQVVHFAGLFEPLIGEFGDPEGIWEKKQLRDMGVVVLEHYFDEARQLMEEFNDLAGKLMADSSLYDDRAFCSDYRDRAARGYELLRRHETEFGMTLAGTLPVSLVRAGLVTTRLAYGLDQDAAIADEVPVVTKRTHLTSDPPTHLTVTVTWRDAEDPRRIAGHKIGLTDFVNPASGASTIALILAAQLKAGLPRAVAHRSISATRQGIDFVHRSLLAVGVESTFYTVGEASELNDHYYLTGERGVGDAGHALRHFLPNWYESKKESSAYDT